MAQDQGMTILRPIESIDADLADPPNGDRQGSDSRRSRRKAWRDGFAAQTVIAGLEDNRSYRAFERTIVASFGPRSVIELELIHRLAALFWRLRRASAIETGLFGLHSAAGYGERARLAYVARQPMKSVPPINGHGQFAFGADDWRDPKINAHKMRFGGVRRSADKSSKSRILAQSFLHLAKLDPSFVGAGGRTRSEAVASCCAGDLDPGWVAPAPAGWFAAVIPKTGRELLLGSGQVTQIIAGRY
jgi:hypothetical protein